MDQFAVKVEEARPAADGRPSAGPVYRSIYAKDGLLELPEGFESPWQFLSDSVKRNPSGRMLGQRQVNEKKAGPYVWSTYQEVYDAAIRMGSAIRSRGVNPGDRCGIYGSNCPQWIIAMEACNSHAVTYVPLYDTLGANAVEFIINHAEVSIAFVQENKIPAIILCLPNCSTHLKTIVSFTNVSSTQKKEAEELGVSCFSWEEFFQLGNSDYELPQKQRTAVCTIMYTSGTTGEPKGVIITNAALMLEVLSTDHILFLTDRVCTEEDSYFSFLPLAHIYDQIIESYCIYKGSSIGFWRGDVRFLLDDLQELKPTTFCGVPRVYDRIYTGIASKVSSGGVLRKTLFQYAYNYKLANLENGLPQEKAAPLLDKLVFNKIKQALGGRVRIMLSGAAPLPRHVEEFLRVTSCSTLSQGYGLSESCGGCFSSIGNVYPMVGTVGVPLTTIEARLESVPELGYDALSSVPRGEICLRGKTLFSGYHKRADLTEEVLIDGWFHTGDIGEWQPNGAMKVIDRKKNIFKLSQGEYVAVESIESKNLQCPLITSVCRQLLYSTCMITRILTFISSINEFVFIFVLHLKARYFPNCSFFEAMKGHRASWSWASLLEARDVLVEGSSWQVICGSSIHIWKDKWLSPPNVGLVSTTGPIPSNAPTLVSSLIDWDIRSWSLDQILHLIRPSEVGKILAIPIGDGEGVDRLIWPWNKDGNYSVRSGYHWIHSQQGRPSSTSVGSSHAVDSNCWKLLWKIDTLPKVKNFLWKVFNNAAPSMLNLFRRKLILSPGCPICGAMEESFEHMLLLCPWVEPIWFGSPICLKINKQQVTTFDLWLLFLNKSLPTAVEKKKILTLVSFICWAIWKARCGFVYQSKVLSPVFTLKSALDLAFEYWDATALRPCPPSSSIQPAFHSSTSSWSPPPPGFVKVNCDAAWKPPASSGLGVVIRNHDGTSICGSYTRNISNSVDIAEAQAILAGINLASENHLKKIKLESDSKAVILDLKRVSSCKNWQIFPIIEEIRRKSARFEDISWDWIPRIANRAAHCAASLAFRSVDPLRWAAQPPPSLTMVLRNDGLPCPHVQAVLE